MKICNRCGIEKDILSFGNKSRNPDGKQNSCILCKRNYDNLYHKNRSTISKEKKLYTSNNRRKNTLSYICEYKLSKGCIDCGYNINAAALQFDHKSDKLFNISDMVRRGYSIDTIFDEISKCDVRCGNCHLIKTSKQQGWYKK